MHVHLFAYGTLQIPAVIRAVVGTEPPSVEATLHGYAQFLVKGATFPGIIETNGGCVTGRVYGSLDAAAFARLDAYEGPLIDLEQAAMIRQQAEQLNAR